MKDDVLRPSGPYEWHRVEEAQLRHMEVVARFRLNTVFRVGERRAPTATWKNGRRIPTSVCPRNFFTCVGRGQDDLALSPRLSGRLPRRVQAIEPTVRESKCGNRPLGKNGTESSAKNLEWDRLVLVSVRVSGYVRSFVGFGGVAEGSEPAGVGG
jgi:hypothetical protein